MSFNKRKFDHNETIKQNNYLTDSFRENRKFAEQLKERCIWKKRMYIPGPSRWPCLSIWNRSSRRRFGPSCGCWKSRHRWNFVAHCWTTWSVARSTRRPTWPCGLRSFISRGRGSFGTMAAIRRWSVRCISGRGFRKPARRSSTGCFPLHRWHDSQKKITV